MRRRGALSSCAAALLLLGFASSAAARTTKTGYDISWPQCNQAYPKGQAFGIVGVNGGLANDPNGCLGSELTWAGASPGLSSPSQAPASLYINTADPGPRVSDWPNSGAGGSFGTCNGSWSQACAYVYGQTRATYSYALVSATTPYLASAAPWWLDIETSNTWATSSVAGYKGLNIAAIQGFMDGLVDAGAPEVVGIYSIGNQWNAITGLTAQTTASAFGSSPPSWVAGATTLRQAQSVCSSTGFTGGPPALAQYSAGGFDGDLRCG